MADAAVAVDAAVVDVAAMAGALEATITITISQEMLETLISVTRTLMRVVTRKTLRNRND